MGSFANTLFSVLLGWVQNAVAWLWQLAGREDAGSFMGWVLDHWLMLAVLLCAAGVVIDFVVYLLRWQPWRVWRSFWGRLLSGDEEEAAEPVAEEAPVVPRQWVYADGSTAIEAPPQPAAVQPAVPDMEELQLDAPVRPVRRVIPARRSRRRAADGSQEYLLPDLGGEKQAYHQPYYPPQWNTGAQETINEGDDA